MDVAELVGTIKRKNDFVDIWHIKQDIHIYNIKMQTDEVSEVKWVTLKEIKNLIDWEEFVPTITPSLNLIVQYLTLYKNTTFK